jgi:Holliday junction resolvasome RuvABC endonuclease subunit
MTAPVASGVRVVGVDLGLERTGLAWITGQTRTIRPTAGASDPARRLDELDRLISRWFGTRPHVAVIEGPGGGPGGERVTRRLAQLSGLVIVAAFRHCVPYVEVHPMSLKSWAGRINGRAVHSKDDMVSAAYTLGGQPANDDEADAFLLHALGLKFYEPLEHADWPALTATILDLPWPEIRRAA